MTEIKDDKLQTDKMTLIIFAEMMQVQYDKIVEQNKSLQQELREKTAECEELKKEYEDILDSRQREWEEEYERYKQALDEIENRIKKYQCQNCDAEVSECAWCDMKDILDIIKQAKEGEL